MRILSIARFCRVLSIAGLSGVLAIIATTAQSAQDGACNRECLRDVMTQYLNAMVAHNPAGLPVAAGMRFTEDTVELKLGEGLWKDASRVGPYRQEVIDVREGISGAHVVIEANGTPVLLAVRLKVVGGKITEVETQATRNKEQGMLYNPDGLKALHQGMNDTPATHVSRAEMIRVASIYPSGMKAGSFVVADVPFAADAYRFENGQMMAGKGCNFRPPSCEDIKGPTFKPPTKMDYRVLAVDEELGLVWLRMNLGDRGEANQTTDLIAFEMFKVHDGKFHGVEAFLRMDPAGKASGWDDKYPPQIPK